MKILLFEYLCSGGYANRPLPEALAREGLMMLRALAVELSMVVNIQIAVALDPRCSPAEFPESADIHVPRAGESAQQMLARLLVDYDLFWPIAPETDGILQSLAEFAKAYSSLTLLSTTATVRLCASKLATYRYLRRHGIVAAETQRWKRGLQAPSSPSVVKPDDGVGAEKVYVIEYGRSFAWLETDNEQHRAYVMQPWIDGRSYSLSCLFRDGNGWLICVNEQFVEHSQQALHLAGLSVNIPHADREVYQLLVDSIARALPGLRGYIGIDLIETADGSTIILEINPRLTTSYVGIYLATGINVAQQTIRLCEGGIPELQRVHNRTVSIDIETGSMSV